MFREMHINLQKNIDVQINLQKSYMYVENSNPQLGYNFNVGFGPSLFIHVAITT